MLKCFSLPALGVGDHRFELVSSKNAVALTVPDWSIRESKFLVHSVKTKLFCSATGMDHLSDLATAKHSSPSKVAPVNGFGLTV